ncbi:hypothetical protein ACEWY4_005762 [Coilia grayii]|uniref:Insulinoma-associated protein 2 n=1 Tax=Coilia grayii TaxID=363190 RepID=A0ABD1KJJ8_9TELE
MPRGFLVKRSKRGSPASYRARQGASEFPEAHPPALIPDEPASVLVTHSSAPQTEGIQEPWTSIPTETEQGQLPESPRDVELIVDITDLSPQHISDAQPIGSPGRAEAAYSPIKPVSTELKASFFDRCLGSPATAESFPLSTPVSSIERLLLNHGEMKFDTPVQLYSTFHQNLKRSSTDTERKGKPPAKKPKVMRKLNFEDEVTTSPVLGLKIKKEGPETKPTSSSSGRKKPLGEFICQLCKEEYQDPFSLAQHKCSRIVRIEYRCPECDKVFSCPANLASHRRWHKPRAANNGESQGGKKTSLDGRVMEKLAAEEKENASKLRLNNQHHNSLDSSQCHRTADSAHGQEMRRESPPSLRQQYVSPEKCFDLHIRTSNKDSLLHCVDPAEPAAASCLPSPGCGEEVYECCYCGKKFRRQAYLRKHLAAHETIKPSPYSQYMNEQITFPCHLCGAHFPSLEIREKHRLWHAVREDLFLNPMKSAGALVRPELTHGEQQIFSCKHCPSTFFSSPGLTRHINKSHPTESRQVMLLQMAVRPGC